MDLLDLLDILKQPDNGLDEFYSAQMRECLENRVLVFNRCVDESLVEDMVLYIMKWNREDRDIPVDKRKPIILLMHSGGGDVFAGTALVNVLLASSTPTKAIALGLVASAAYDIYLACDERLAFANSIFLQHDGGVDISTSSKKMKEIAEFFTRAMAQRDKDLILSRTNMEESFYDDIYGEEFYFYADKAKELGVVHKIIGDDIDIGEIF